LVPLPQVISWSWWRQVEGVRLVPVDNGLAQTPVVYGMCYGCSSGDAYSRDVRGS
jgi:hypothetical protein